jgi:hypothetical protein
MCGAGSAAPYAFLYFLGCAPFLTHKRATLSLYKGAEPQEGRRLLAAGQAPCLTSGAEAVTNKLDLSQGSAVERARLNNGQFSFG